VEGSTTVEETVTVRRVVEDDWELLRAVRLEMLADTPLAFLETPADAQARTEQEWRFRALRGSAGPTNFAIAAEVAGQHGQPGQPATWVAYMACFVDGPGRAHLVSVYVAPGHRGTGLADRMVREVMRWARHEAGVKRLHLYVHEQLGRPRAFYRRLGFAETGAWLPYELDPAQRDLEMDLALDRC
jgi:ribosomal protein S18 acetylase RimI-like enzyme